MPLSCKDIYLDRYARQDKGWTDRDEAHWPVPYWDIDTGFTALLMLLTAVDERLGALFFGIPPELIGRFRVSMAFLSSTCRSAPSLSGIPTRPPTRAAPARSSSAGPWTS